MYVRSVSPVSHIFLENTISWLCVCIHSHYIKLIELSIGTEIGNYLVDLGDTVWETIHT